MMKIDIQLVQTVQRMITGANVHRINTLLFQYQQSVTITNARNGSTVDPAKYEKCLRE